MSLCVWVLEMGGRREYNQITAVICVVIVILIIYIISLSVFAQANVQISNWAYKNKSIALLTIRQIAGNKNYTHTYSLKRLNTLFYTIISFEHK